MNEVAEKELEKMQREKAVTQFIMGVIMVGFLLYSWYQHHQRKKEMEEALKNGFFFSKPAQTAPETPHQRTP